MDPGCKLLIWFSVACGAAIVAIGTYDHSPLEALSGVAVGAFAADFWRRRSREL